MSRRYELTEKQWELIKDLLPDNQGRGRPWADHRKLINGMFWILNSGAPWRDMPGRYGPWETVYTRFCRWQEDGTIDKIIERLQLALDEHGFIDHQLWCIDGTSIRAHKSASGGGKKRALTNHQIMPWDDPEEAGDPRSIWYLTEEERHLVQQSQQANATNPEALNP